MKKVSINILAAFILVCTSSMTYAQDSIKCVINDNGTMKSFMQIKGDSTDHDLYSIEKYVSGSFRFLLKEGHGMMGLDIYKNDKFHASTLIQKGTLTPFSDLNLGVIDDKGERLHAICTHLLEE